MNVTFLSGILLMLFAAGLYAAPGKLLLVNGHSIEGDITVAENGACTVMMRSGSVEFEEQEVKKIVYYSKKSTQKDLVRERFLCSFRNTPAESAPRRTKSTPYDSVIHKEAQHHNVDPALVKAVIKAESNFNPNDRSSKGACGLMQLMPGTARLLGVKRIYAPEENIKAGTQFLSDMLDMYDGDVEKALAAYNAGPGAVKRYGGRVPPFKETQQYIENVNRYYNDYRNPGKVCAYTDDSGRLNLYNAR